MPCRSAVSAKTGMTRLPTPAAATPAKSPKARRRLRAIDLRPLRHFGGSLRVPPPHGGESRATVFRHCLRMSKTIPARGACIGVRPLRHHVEIPQQNPVQRLGGGDEFDAI